ncbi:MAG: protein-L-isoaspartate(D-aspartate) O-methyltransferase [Candidatus Lokiarchaeota archaeon]|nr:protein-L-isoaspartate(D-aspartate) O-methyltransferase [Candidatus Lokiarchaeota archaeon]
MSTDDLLQKKDSLIARLKAKGYLKSETVERAVRKVPREEFVPTKVLNQSYVDRPLSIHHGQTISAPHMCVIMCETMKLEEGHSVLEIGAGSGYHAALCAEIVAPEKSSNPGHIYTIEIVESLIKYAEKNLERSGYSDRVTLIHGDGGKGYSERAPYDRVLVTAAAPEIPKPLIEQLAPNGIMAIPVGSRGWYQELKIVHKDSDGKIKIDRWGGVAFVPLTGEFGH